MQYCHVIPQSLCTCCAAANGVVADLRAAVLLRLTASCPLPFCLLPVIYRWAVVLNPISLRHNLAVLLECKRWLEQLSLSCCDKPAGQYLSARSQQQLHGLARGRADQSMDTEVWSRRKFPCRQAVTFCDLATVVPWCHDGLAGSRVSLPLRLSLARCMQSG